MTKVVGPWLASLYDSDRMVIRAARDSLVAVFKSEDKLKSIWKLYSSIILKYCRNIVENERVYTLSDERSTSADDAEAKFARVMMTAVMEVAYLISTSPPEELVKDEENGENFASFYTNKELWKLAYHPDSALRRAVYKLLQVTLDKHPGSYWPDLNVPGIFTDMFRVDIC